MNLTPPVVAAMQQIAVAWRWPLLLKWPEVADVLWVSSEGAKWNLPAIGPMQIVIKVWWN